MADSDNDSARAGPPRDASYAREIALRLLTIRARSRQELELAMAKKQVPDELISEVLGRLSAVGLVDDLAFARSWVRNFRARGRSVSLLRRELRQKGIEDELIDEALSELDDDRDVAGARQLAEKKLAAMSGLPREVQYRRIAGALARRGFSPSVCRTVLSEIL